MTITNTNAEHKEHASETTKDTAVAQGGPQIQDMGEASKKTMGAFGFHFELANPPFFRHP